MNEGTEREALGANERPVRVLKIGGSQIDDREFLAQMVEAVRDIRRRGVWPVIVHGGGQEIVRLHDEMGVPFDIVEGLRVTSDQSIRLVKMALNGIANLRVVRWLVNGGVDAIGLNGIDLGWIRVERHRVGDVDLGRVGKVKHVHAHRLIPLLEAGLTPVISPISLGMDGLSYNVNADQVAEAVAVALEAQELAFITNVSGILVAGRPMRALPAQQIEDLIFGQFITGGMIPKARAAAAAVKAGVTRAVITDLEHYIKGEGTFIVR
ncbi:MAG: acetylglutamate kinase [Chloroflexi bacterium]|nr:acetylglutamate kinase [Chloroflexota bacterium]